MGSAVFYPGGRAGEHAREQRADTLTSQLLPQARMLHE
jgi:hypothetical protein